ncbi:hypothetical protein L7F22_006933 [Adiantum nelumboides]|nr:hypothetical protein [Adiantum nelumboides]
MRYYGPFQITERINDVSFRLRLPDIWKIHNAFHVSLLKPFKGDVPDDGEPDEQPEVEENEEILVPERYWHIRIRRLKVNACCDHQSQEGFNAAANNVSRELLCQIHAKEFLSQAIEDCTMAVAFTRRTGKIRLPSFTLSQLIAPEHENLKLALVFGREDCGLYTEELLQCTHVCTICTGTWQGSLNLSHAVTVVLSRLYESWAPEKIDIYETKRPDSVVYNTLPGTASVSEVENLLHRWENVFMSCNYWAKWAGMPEFKTPDRLFLFLRKLLQRGRPSVREVAYLHGFLTVIENLASCQQNRQKSRL